MAGIHKKQVRERDTEGEIEKRESDRGVQFYMCECTHIISTQHSYTPFFPIFMPFSNTF